MDEYQRATYLETFAIGAAVTAGVTFTFGFLENAGFPRLSMFTVRVLEKHGGKSGDCSASG